MVFETLNGEKVTNDVTLDSRWSITTTHDTKKLLNLVSKQPRCRNQWNFSIVRHIFHLSDKPIQPFQ